MNIGRVVSARQSCELSGFCVVDHQDALDREKQLRELDAWCGNKHRTVFHRADDVAPVRRDLRQQTERALAVVALVVAPRHDVLVGERHLFGHGQDGVAALVVAVVHVQAKRAAVFAKRVAVAAHRQVVQHHRRRVGRIHRAKPPANFGRVLNSRDKRQGHLAVENGIAHRIFGRLYPHLRGRARRTTLIQAHHGDPCVLLNAGGFYGLPVGAVWSPGRFVGCKAQHVALTVQLHQYQPTGHVVGVVLPLEKGRCHVRRKKCVLKRVANGKVARRCAWEGDIYVFDRRRPITTTHKTERQCDRNRHNAAQQRREGH